VCAGEKQTTSTVLMIAPAAFAANDQTATSNHFQQLAEKSPDTSQRARAEFDGLVAALRAAGVEVMVVPDTPFPVKPDAVFPNNWFSTHADGTVVLYPMMTPNRRIERRLDVIEELRVRGFVARSITDLSGWEQRGHYLEGTGSLVLDRVHRIAYACRSVRTSSVVLAAFAAALGYRIVMFDAKDALGRPIYHTNVMLSIGSRFAAICLEAIPDREARMVAESLVSTGHEIVELSLSQITAFAGNMLELGTSTGSCIALSSAARKALTATQKGRLEALAGPLVCAPIETIEKQGGGSVRCMLAEIHLPRSTS
jgi:hypothetical protein